MTNGASNGQGERTALLVVRNAFEHDARVLRAARTVAALGFDTTVLAVVSPSERRTAVELDGIHVRRIGPSSGIERKLYRRLRGAGRAPVADAGSGRSGNAAGTSRRRPGPPRRLARFAATLAYYRRGISFVRAMGPDLVHCNDYNTMWIGVAARYLVGSVVVYDSHELWPDRNLRPEPRWWLMLCEALFVRVADRVVMTSPAHAEVLARRYRVPEPVVVRNIPASAPAPATTQRERPEVAAYVGGLLRNRGLEQSIEALPAVPHARLRLIGPVAADYRAELGRLAASIGVAERVEFPGAVPPTKVVDALADADVGVALFQPICLSHRLVLPNKLFEYAIAGLPVLASDLPMIARFVDEHGLGVTVDSQDVSAVAAGLAEVLNPERNRSYREGARRAAESLDWEREQELLAGVYREALTAGRG